VPARYGGHVINVSATLAELADSGTPAVLAALTSGLAAATRSLAVEYSSHGIRVNAVSPGIIEPVLPPADGNGSLGGSPPATRPRGPGSSARHPGRPPCIHGRDGRPGSGIVK